MADRFPGDEVDALLDVSYVDLVETAEKSDVIAKKTDLLESYLLPTHIIC
jgi:hypothetical protein